MQSPLMQDLGDFIDMETMQFVNPYEVNPIILDTTQQVSVNQDYLILKDEIATQNKLKMEEFSDLSAILSAENLDLTGSIDEVSTPVFDKEIFDFASTKPAETESTTNLKVKVEFNAQYYSGGLLATNSPIQNNNETFSISTTLDNILTFNNKEPLNDPTSFASSTLSINNVKNSYSAAPSPQDDRYSYISSPDQQEVNMSTVPEHYNYSYDNKLKLNLMTDEFKFPFKAEGLSTLNTPDVIEGVVNMGNEFNILDLVNNEDITILNADEELLSALTSPTTTAFSSEPSTPSTTLSSTKKLGRRKRFSSEDDDDDDDDDEDYLPPTKKQLTTVRFSDIEMEQSSSSDDYHPVKKSKPRGRPPKQVSGSEGQKDVSKYRELRDKNNEASRKSRLKRKVKEKEYEKEADSLYEKNIRLKAQVEELEKMVSTFRNNLFKIMVNK